MGPRIKILVSFESEYRSYQEVIAATISILRPHAEVATSDLDALGDELERFKPHLVISSRPKPARFCVKSAWIEFPLGVGGSAKFHMGEYYSVQHNPTLETMLKTIDEFERLASMGEGCSRC